MEEKKPEQPLDKPLAKNDNPRGNENLSNEQTEEASAEDVGSEITDGEDA